MAHNQSYYMLTTVGMHAQLVSVLVFILVYDYTASADTVIAVLIHELYQKEIYKGAWGTRSLLQNNTAVNQITWSNSGQMTGLEAAAEKI